MPLHILTCCWWKTVEYGLDLVIGALRFPAPALALLLLDTAVNELVPGHGLRLL